MRSGCTTFSLVLMLLAIAGGAAADCLVGPVTRIPIESDPQDPLPQSHMFGSPPSGLIDPNIPYAVCLNYLADAAPLGICRLAFGAPIARFDVVPGWRFRIRSREIPGGLWSEDGCFIVTVQGDADGDGTVGLDDHNATLSEFGTELR